MTRSRLKTIKTLLSFAAVEAIGRTLNWPIMLFLPLIIPAEEYGTVGLIVAMEGLLLELFAIGQNRAILRFYRTDDKKEVLIYTILVLWFIVAGIIFFSCFCLLMSSTQSFFSIPIYPHLIFFLVAILLRNTNRMCEAISRCEGSSKAFAFFKIGFQILKILTITLLAVILKSAFSYVLGMLTALLLMLFWIAPFLKKRSVAHIQKERLKTLVVFGWPFVFHVLSGSILAYVGRFILVGLAGKEDVAVYTLASTFGTGVFLAFSALSAYFEPKIYQYSEDQVRSEKHLCLYGNLGQAAASFLSICTLLIAPFLIKRFYDSTYHSVVLILPLILGSTITRAYYLQGNYRLVVYRKTMYIAICTIISALLNIVLNIYLIPTQGVKGAALALLISNIFLACFMYAISIFEARISIRQLQGIGGLILSILLVSSLSFFEHAQASLFIFFALAINGLWHIAVLSRRRSGMHP